MECIFRLKNSDYGTWFYTYAYYNNFSLTSPVEGLYSSEANLEYSSKILNFM